MRSYEQVLAKLSSLKINKIWMAHPEFSSRIRASRLYINNPKSSTCITHPRRRVLGHKWVLWSDNSEISTTTKVWASRNERQGSGVKRCSEFVIWHPLKRMNTSYGHCAFVFIREGRNMDGGLKITLIKSMTPENSIRHLCWDRGPIQS
jgi:hypothetical protein